MIWTMNRLKVTDVFMSNFSTFPDLHGLLSLHGSALLLIHLKTMEKWRLIVNLDVIGLRQDW